MLGELFTPVETPEAPNRGFFKGLFGGGAQSLDREELCMPNMYLMIYIQYISVLYVPSLHAYLSFLPSISWWSNSWKGIAKSGPAHPWPRWHWGDEGSCLWCGWWSGTCPDSTRWKRPETGWTWGEDGRHDGQCRLFFQTRPRGEQKCQEGRRAWKFIPTINRATMWHHECSLYISATNKQ